MKAFQKALRFFFASKKITFFVGFVVVFVIGFQNCAPHLFTSPSELEKLERECSLDSVDSSIILKEVINNGVPAAWSTLDVGSKVRFWLSNPALVDGAQWQLMTLASGSPEAIGEPIRGSESTFPSGTGLEVGNYIVRVTLSKSCDAPRRVVFDIPFSVDNGQCSDPLGHVLLADDPKMVNTPVNFTVQLAAGCKNSSHSTTWNFRDGTPVLPGGDTISHPFSFAGLYSALSHLVFTADDVERDLYKQVVITSPPAPPCPTVNDLFVSGPRLVNSGKLNTYQLHNVPGGACDLGITSVVFNYADGVTQSPGAPYQVMHAWNPATVPTTYNMQVLVNYGLGLSRTIPVLVTVTDLACPADSASSILIVGPASAPAGSTLSHSVNLPRCLIQGTNFNPVTDVSWSITGPAASTATGFTVSQVYNLAGLYTLKATIVNTRVASFDVNWNLHIYETPIVDNTTTTSTTTTTLPPPPTTSTTTSTTTTTLPPPPTTTTTTSTTTTTRPPPPTTTTTTSTTTSTRPPPPTTTTTMSTTTTTRPRPPTTTTTSTSTTTTTRPPPPTTTTTTNTTTTTRKNGKLPPGKQPQQTGQWFCRPSGTSGLYCPTGFGNGEGPGQFPELECKLSTPGGNCIN